MNWSNVRLIFLREVRDQLRDRRMIFMVAVLPLLLYPLLGLNWLQISQFMQERPADILLVGAAELAEVAPLVAGAEFQAGLCDESVARLLRLKVAEPEQVFAGLELDDPTAARDAGARLVRGGGYQVVVLVPPGTADAIGRILQANLGEPTAPTPHEAPPSPEVLFDGADDASRLAAARVDEVLRRWRDSVVQRALAAREVSPALVAPVAWEHLDVAEQASLRAARWSKLLPFVVVIWALTGAFYPAVDLCAGEKERGTLETLLCSPAQRDEIVWGKLLTVMAFSVATSLLNLLSMAVTGLLVLGRLRATGMGAMALFEPPPVLAFLWLTVGLLPIAALFSALALAIAAFARSSKEGQYYLMPLLLVTLPLMMLPMMAELSLGTALIPVSGLMMVLRCLIEAQYSHALVFLPPVVAVTGVCCLLAIRWAVYQFHQEGVLFRECERFQLGAWLRRLFFERGATPSVAEALLCAVVLMSIRFFASFQASGPSDWGGFARMAVVSLVALIATPALLMTIMLTREPLRTLGLRRPVSWWAVPAAALLALALHPLVHSVKSLVEHLYPLGPEMAAQMESMQTALAGATWWQAVLVLALLPAVCEELAFRGFILSGLRHLGNKWAAIGLASLFFGVSHILLQQSLLAALVGVVIGYICVRGGSLYPAIVFHFTHNATAVLLGQVGNERVVERLLSWPAVVAGTMGAAALLQWFRSLEYERTPEELLHERLDHPLMAESSAVEQTHADSQPTDAPQLAVEHSA